MCRLLGWATSAPATLLDLLGDEDLADFTGLSDHHGDGWGVARAAETGVEVHKRPDPAHGSRSFRAWPSRTTDRCSRPPRSTRWWPHGLRGCGAARPTASATSWPCSSAWRTARRRTKRWLDTVDEIAHSSSFTSLNCLLMTPEELIALCRYDPAGPVEDRDPEYYRLRYRVTDGAVVVSSSGRRRDWQDLANGDLLVVRRGTSATRVAPGSRLLAGR